MNPIEIFIQAGIDWLILILFIRNVVIPVVEIFTDEIIEEEINFQI
jgi:hypothetical protein